MRYIIFSQCTLGARSKIGHYFQRVKRTGLKGEILKVQRYSSRLHFQIILVRSHEFFFQVPTWKIYRSLPRRLDLKKVYVRIIPLRRTRGSPLTVDIVAPLPTIIFYSSGSFCSAHNRVNARRKGPSNTLWKQAFYRICAFREQRPRICARHSVIFVHGRWLTLHPPPPRNFSHLCTCKKKNGVFVRPNTLRTYARIHLYYNWILRKYDCVTSNAKYLNFNKLWCLCVY